MQAYDLRPNAAALQAAGHASEPQPIADARRMPSPRRCASRRRQPLGARCALAFAGFALFGLAVSMDSSHTAARWMLYGDHDGGSSLATAQRLRILAPPRNDTEMVRLAHGSCAHQDKAQAFWGPLRAYAPQLFIFNGDIVYGDCGSDACPELPQA